jgi:hypothetical protein
MDMDMDMDNRGETHYLCKKEWKSNGCYSSRSHPSASNQRGRRKANDRHSHHRRRIIVKNLITKNATDSIPKSTTCIQKRKDSETNNSVIDYLSKRNYYTIFNIINI